MTAFIKRRQVHDLHQQEDMDDGESPDMSGSHHLQVLVQDVVGDLREGPSAACIRTEASALGPFWWHQREAQVGAANLLAEHR